MAVQVGKAAAELATQEPSQHGVRVTFLAGEGPDRPDQERGVVGGILFGKIGVEGDEILIGIQHRLVVGDLGRAAAHERGIGLVVEVRVVGKDDDSAAIPPVEHLKEKQKVLADPQPFVYPTRSH